MSLPPLAPVSELEVRLGLAVGSISGVDLARAGAALGDASALVRAESGLPWVDVDDVTITAPEEVVFVALRAALRAYRNPDGVAAESLGGGAYSYSVSQKEQGVYLTSDEVRIVKAAALAASGPGGVFSVRTPSAYGEAVAYADPFVFGA